MASMQKKIESLSVKNRSEAVEDELKGIDIPKGSILEDIVDWAEYVADSDGITIKAVLEDLLDRGVDSGITFLVTFEDGKNFFNEHKDEINRLLGNHVYNVSGEPYTCNGWDEDDPLAFGEQNQFHLSAFAFEEVARDLLEKIPG